MHLHYGASSSSGTHNNALKNCENPTNDYAWYSSHQILGFTTYHLGSFVFLSHISFPAGLADLLTDSEIIDYNDIPYFPQVRFTINFVKPGPSSSDFAKKLDFVQKNRDFSK